MVTLFPATASAQSDNTRFFVGLRDGRVLDAETISIRERGFGGSYLIVDGRDQVLLTDVLYFQNQDGYFIHEPIEGSNRSTLMRREFDGRIAMYSVTQVVYNSPNGINNNYRYNNGFNQNQGWREKTTYYFRKDNGPVQRYNYRNLKYELSDNPESAALLQEVGRQRFAMYGLYVAGAGVSIWSMLRTLTEGSVPISTWIGLGLLTVPTFVGGSIDTKMEQAVLLYNKAY